MGQIQKKGPGDISPRARELNRRAESVNMHDHMMFEFAIRKALGQQNVFDRYFFWPIVIFVVLLVLLAVVQTY